MNSFYNQKVKVWVVSWWTFPLPGFKRSMSNTLSLFIKHHLNGQFQAVLQIFHVLLQWLWEQIQILVTDTLNSECLFMQQLF